MKNLFISIALIRHFVDERGYWLGVLDEETGEFGFVTGERLEEESFRESVVREIAWKLDLRRDRDFLVSGIAQISTQFVGWLAGTDEEMNVAVTFYPVHLYGKAARTKIEEHPDTRWLTADEICDGNTGDGIRIDERLVDLVNRTRVIQHWEST